jgi:hypothetical protein
MDVTQGLPQTGYSNSIGHAHSDWRSKSDEIGAATVWLARLRKHIIGEQILGLAILLIVSILGSIRPAINQF